jgi:hypothetical protein
MKYLFLKGNSAQKNYDVAVTWDDMRNSNSTVKDWVILVRDTKFLKLSLMPSSGSSIIPAYYAQSMDLAPCSGNEGHSKRNSFG